MNETILNAMNWRYAVKTFDTTKTVSDEDIATILESARLAPSSVGLEPWKFFVVTNTVLRTKLRAAGYDQSKITDAPYLVVLTHRTDAQTLPAELIARTSNATGATPESLDGLKGIAEGSVAGHSSSSEIMNGWLAAQTYIALGIMLETAALLGVDACPMEGFDVNAVNKILGLKEKNLAVTTMVVFGYRGEDSHAVMPKTRRDYNEVIEVV